jgi:hypothetical protein
MRPRRNLRDDRMHVHALCVRQDEPTFRLILLIIVWSVALLGASAKADLRHPTMGKTVIGSLYWPGLGWPAVHSPLDGSGFLGRPVIFGSRRDGLYRRGHISRLGETAVSKFDLASFCAHRYFLSFPRSLKCNAKLDRPRGSQEWLQIHVRPPAALVAAGRTSRRETARPMKRITMPYRTEPSQSGAVGASGSVGPQDRGSPAPAVACR